MTALNQGTVIAAIRRFVELWNAGDIAAACDIYARDAKLVSGRAFRRGRDEILEACRAACPDKSRMGTYDFEIIEIIPSGSVSIKTTLATAFVRWKLGFDDGRSCTGFSLMVFKVIDDKVRIVQDFNI